MSNSGTTGRIFLAVACLVAGTAFLQSACEAWENRDEEVRFVVGVGTHFAQKKHPVEESVELMRRSGVTALRDDAPWSAVERERDILKIPEEWDRYIDEAHAAGIAPLLIFDYGNRLYDDGGKPRSPEAVRAFARYAAFVAGHFQGRVGRYEVWNEWEGHAGGAEGGTLDEYVALAKEVCKEVEATVPEAEILVGGFSSRAVKDGWIEELVRRGMLDHADGLSLHSYNYWEKERKPEDWAEWMASLASELREANGGEPVPLYVTEMGWPSHRGPQGVSPEQQARYLARLFLLARTVPGLQGLWWYDFQNDGWNEDYREENFGVVFHDLAPKPAYFALRAIARAVARARFLGRIPSGEESFWGLRFGDEDGEEAWALWCSEEDCLCRVVLESEAAPPLEIGETGWETVPVEWREDGEESLPRFSVTVGEMPWIVKGDLSRVTILSDVNP